MTKEELLAKNPLYESFHAEWLFYVRSYLGGKFYREGDYLLKHPYESDANYRRRKSIAYYYNYCAPIVDILVAFLYRKPPQRKYGELSKETVPPRKPKTLFDSFWWNVDYEGTSFDQFMRNAQSLAGVYGRISIIVDKPQLVTTTQAEALEQDIRPYLTVVTPQNLLDWKYVRFYGKPILDRVKIAEEWDKDGKEPVKVRIWTREGWELWQASKDRKEASLIDAGFHGLGEVPMVNLYNRKSGMPMIGISDLQDIADINKNIYYLCSNAKEIIENTAFPMLTVPYESGQGTELEVGAKNVLQFDADRVNSRPAWLEAPHSSLAEIRAWVEMDTREMARIAKMGGVKNTETSTQPWSGVAIEAQQDMLKAALVEKADNAEQAELDVLRLWCKWEGRKFEGDVEYPRDFAVRDLTIALQNAISAKKAGVMSVAFERELQKKIVSATLSEADEAKRQEIEKEIEEKVQDVDSGDKGEIYEYYLKVKGGLITKNEIRKRKGLPPLKKEDGGEEFVELADNTPSSGDPDGQTP